MCDTRESDAVLDLGLGWGSSSSSSHIARCSCAHGDEESQKLTSCTARVCGNCLCVLARDWLGDPAIPSHLSLGCPLLIAKSIAVHPVYS